MRAPPVGTIFRFGGPKDTLVEVLSDPFMPSGVGLVELLQRVRLTENERVWYAPWRVIRRSRTTWFPVVQLLGWMDKT